MVLHGKLFGWGYGFFSCNAGEHLNKIIKTSEMHNTNFSQQRFRDITRLLRTKQFYFPESLIPSTKTVTCSACNQTGHNRKNKSCPLHPSHPDIEFDESDTEDNI